MKILRNYPLELLQLMLICKNHTSEVNLVGGCVRDMLLNKQPKDFDIVIVAVGKHQGRVDRSLEHCDAKGIFSAAEFLK